VEKVGCYRRSKNLTWFKVLGKNDNLPEGRVKTVVAGNLTMALTHFDIFSNLYI
jgi:hypothetical protein